MTEYSEDLSVVMSQNGRRSYHFVTPLLEGYSLAREPYREFRKGVKITTYQNDSLTTVDAVLTANYAIYYENRELWEAKGNVVVEKSDGKTRARASVARQHCPQRHFRRRPRRARICRAHLGGARMKPYVCVVGAVNLDICGRPEKKLIFRDSNPGAVTLTPGGVGRNIAHDLRLLGVEVKFLTAFGGDSHAQLLRNDCVELGMDLSCALDVPGGRTSTYLYITDERGEMQLGLCDTDISAAITPAYLQRHLDVLNSAAAVVLDGNLTAETITWLGTHCSAPLFADPVSVTKAERMRAALGALHTFKPNLTEGQNLTGESTPEGIVAALLAQGVQRVFLSMGADGILAGTRAELVHLPCLPTCMVNTTGGGDAVMAALVWAYLQGRR